MSTVTTSLCQYGHENCYRHMNAQQVILRRAENSPVVDLLDLFEGLPVVLRAARYARGLGDLGDAAKATGVNRSTLLSAERGEPVRIDTLWRILEWLGPLTRAEWDELRRANVPPVPMGRKELLEELRIAMRGGSNDRHVIARRVGYTNAESLSRRLWRMGEAQLANYFDSDQHDTLGPDSVRPNSTVSRILSSRPSKNVGA